jgi:hypothetical protein
VPAFERGAVPNANANTANVISTSFFPMVDSIVLSGGLNPATNAELPKKMAAVQITQRLNEEVKTASSSLHR